MPLAQLQIDAVEIELAAIEEDQLGRSKGRDLAGELAADGSAGAGDQHPPAADQAVDGEAVEGVLRPSQEVLEGDRPQIRSVRAGGILELGQPGQAGGDQPELLGLLEQRLLGRPVDRRRIAHDQPPRPLAAGGETLNDRREVGKPAEHRRAVNRSTLDAVGVIQHADHAVEGARRAHRADELLGRIADAEQEHRDGLRSPRSGEKTRRMMAQETIGKARPAEHDDQEAPLNHRHRTRQRLQSVDQEQQREEQQDRQGRCLGNVGQVVHRGIAPEAPIHPEEEECRQCDDDERGDHGSDRLPIHGKQDMR